MKTLLLFFAVFAGVWLSSYTNLNMKPNKIRKVVIDAGHGGKDPGCLGKKCVEKDIALQVAYGFGSNIRMHMKDVEIVYTRTKDEFIELRERARKANKEGSDFFISIHANASTSPEMYGTESYIMGLSSSEENLEVAKRENSSILQEHDYQSHYKGFDPKDEVSNILMLNYQNAYHYNSLRMAQKVEDHFKYKLLRHSRGVKQANFVVLQKVAMPSILVEIGFLTNSNEESFLTGNKGKAHIADELYKAFRDYKTEFESR
jgi:N-acetylmuramoyl-L-alanine amidase